MKKIISIILSTLFLIIIISNYNNVYAEDESLQDNKAIKNINNEEVEYVNTEETSDNISNEYIENEFIIKFKTDDIKALSEEDMESEVKALVEEEYITVTSNESIAETLMGSSLQLVKYQGEEGVEEVIDSIYSNYGDLIEYIEPNYTITIDPTEEIVDSEESINENNGVSGEWTSYDYYYNSLWGLKNKNFNNIDINAENAWNITRGNSNIVVAVIDSGVNINHSDLRNNIYKNQRETLNGKDDDGNGYIDDINGWDFFNNDNDPNDENGHGTHVAGIIAAEANTIGVIGVAPNIKIMPLRFLDRNARGSIENAIRAIDYAAKMNVPIVNNSWGGYSYSKSLYDALKTSNALQVCSAGNEANNNDMNPAYPSSYDLDNIISVASIDMAGGISNFSNYGKNSVDVGAPGADILSTLLNNSYGYGSGTSMAAPYVAGIAALIKSKYTYYTPSEIKSIIMNNVDSLSSLQGRTVTGGLVDAYKALGTASGTGILYQTHVQNYGWQDWKSDGETSGTSGQSKRLEAIKIKLNNIIPGASISYRTHVQDYGWQGWKSDGEISGTSGQSKRLEAIEIKLNNAPGYSVQYRVHVQDYGWQEWKVDGEMAGTSGKSKRLEAIEIKIVKNENIDVEYRTHVQDYGWQNWKLNGEMAGTSGQSKRLEAIQIEIYNAPDGASIAYQTHVQDYGWQEWMYDGEVAGTIGRSKRLEGIKIELENAPGYSVEYRVHIQDYGWQGWKSDGEMAGTIGQSKRLEGIEIRVVRK